MAGLCSVSDTSPRPSAGQLLWELLLLTVHREVEDQIQLLPYLQELDLVFHIAMHCTSYLLE